MRGVGISASVITSHSVGELIRGPSPLPPPLCQCRCLGLCFPCGGFTVGCSQQLHVTTVGVPVNGGGREGGIACMGGFLPRDGWVGRRWRCPRCPAMPGSCRGHQPSQGHTAVPAGWCGQAGAMGGSGVGGGWVAFVWLHCGTSRRRCQPVTIPRRPTYCDRPTFSPVPHPTLPPSPQPRRHPCCCQESPGRFAFEVTPRRCANWCVSNAGCCSALC